MISDHYKTLGLKPSATIAEVKAAHQRLAKLYHPDRHNGCKDMGRKLQMVNVARDEILKYGNSGSNTNSNTNSNRKASSSQPIKEEHYNFVLDLHEAFRPVMRFTMTRGYYKDIRVVNPQFNDGYSGSFINSPHIHIHVTYNKHPFYEILGKDLYCKITVPYKIAKRGGTVKIPNPAMKDGMMDLKIPAGLTSGNSHVTGGGIPAGNGTPAGDKIVHVTVESPKGIKDKISMFLEKMANVLD